MREHAMSWGEERQPIGSFLVLVAFWWIGVGLVDVLFSGLGVGAWAHVVNGQGSLIAVLQAAVHDLCS
jgi:TM2 domain-containing membrane protein YozV